MAKSKQTAQTKRVPQRICIICRQPASKRSLTRLVRTETGIDVDPTGKKAGRGAYLCSKITCWESALATNRIGLALKTKMNDVDRQKISEFMDTLTMEDHV